MMELNRTVNGELFEEAEQLMKKANEARKNAYTPYSHFSVGAALLVKDGSIVTGCNIENAAYSPGNCAERTAIFKAVSEGKRSFCAIAVAGAKENDIPDGNTICSPCGVCRQVLCEFCNPRELRVYLTDGTKLYCYTLEELLPLSFGPDNL